MAITTQQFNKLVTKKDLKKELEKFTTKKDLEKLGQETKKDLKELGQETKKDLEKFAIRAFNTFSIKEDIKELRQEMASKNDLIEFKNEILTAIDSVAKEQQDSRMERAANIGAHDRIEEEIIKTNKRVTIVEKKIEAVSVAA